MDSDATIQNQEDPSPVKECSQNAPEKRSKPLSAPEVAKAYWDSLDMVSALISTGYSSQVAKRCAPKWMKNERVAYLILNYSKLEYLQALRRCARGELKKENVDAAERLYSELCKIWQPILSSNPKSNKNEW